jgi:hypothetical protein
MNAASSTVVWLRSRVISTASSRMLTATTARLALAFLYMFSIQAHGPTHGQRRGHAALAETDVAELPRADEHRPVHDHHRGQDHRPEPQVHPHAVGSVLTTAMLDHGSLIHRTPERRLRLLILDAPTRSGTMLLRHACRRSVRSARFEPLTDHEGRQTSTCRGANLDECTRSGMIATLVVAAAVAGCDAGSPTPDALARGAELYQAHRVACHGKPSGGTISEIPPRHTRRVTPGITPTVTSSTPSTTASHPKPVTR